MATISVKERETRKMLQKKRDFRRSVRTSGIRTDVLKLLTGYISGCEEQLEDPTLVGFLGYTIQNSPF